MATTKEQLLQYFQGLDVSLLEKLRKYSQLLIIPDEDLLVNATMSQMVDKAHSLADSLFPEWTDRSKSDFGEFLVELFSLFSEKDFWYINAFANEGILSKMRSYSNAFSKASSMGYQPKTCAGASCNFSIIFSAGETIKYERGDLVVAVGDLKFTNDEAFTVEKNSSPTTKTISLQEGEQVAEDVTYNGYNVFIRRKNVDVNSISVAIDNISYERVPNFGNSLQESYHFMILPEEDGSCSIHFGSNGFGVQPAIGKTIRVEYRLCNGSDGNIEVSTASINDSLSDREATGATMLSSANGGTYAETFTSIKEKAPLYFKTKRAVINETIAEDVLNGFPFVHKSKVTLLGREVIYRIIPSSGDLEPTESDILSLQENFDPYIMAGYSSSYAENIYRDLLGSLGASASKIILDVIILAGYSSDSIENSIRQIMNDLTNPLIKANYGGSFNKTDTDLLIRSSVPGVQSVSFKVLIGSEEQIMPDVTLNEDEIFSPLSQDNLTVRTNVI